MKSKNILKNNSKSFKFGAVIFLLGIIIFLFQQSSATVKKIFQTPTPSPILINNVKNSSVLKVIDGDTILLSTGEKVRYIGINTPEIENNECFATEAAKINSDLVLGKEVRLVKDVSETDKYGRLLRYVYVGDAFINDELVKVGAAEIETIKPDVRFEETFKTSEKYAKENSLGLWGKCSK